MHTDHGHTDVSTTGVVYRTITVGATKLTPTDGEKEEWRRSTKNFRSDQIRSDQIS